eukprot:1456679-Prymnesium_polylepis.3
MNRPVDERVVKWGGRCMDTPTWSSVVSTCMKTCVDHHLSPTASGLHVCIACVWSGCLDA